LQKLSDDLPRNPLQSLGQNQPTSIFMAAQSFTRKIKDLAEITNYKPGLACPANISRKFLHPQQIQPASAHLSPGTDIDTSVIKDW